MGGLEVDRRRWLSRPLDLANARILVSNDDGIDRRASSSWTKVARALARDVWVVAPEQEQSGASHSLTLYRPLRVRQLGPPPLRRRRHADRLRAARGQRPFCEDKRADARALGRQCRRQSRRGRDLFRHGRRGDGGDAARACRRSPSASTAVDGGAGPLGDRAAHAPEVMRRLIALPLAAQHAHQRQLSRRRARQGHRHRGDAPGHGARSATI